MSDRADMLPFDEQKAINAEMNGLIALHRSRRDAHGKAQAARRMDRLRVYLEATNRLGAAKGR